MQFKIVKTVFLRALQLVQGIADRRATMPILGNVLLRTDGKQRLLCAATDLTLSASIEVEASIQEEGGFTVGARQLHDIVKGLPGSDVQVRKMENLRAEICAGKAEFRVVGLSDRDFPKLPNPREVELFSVEARVLRDLINRTVYASSTDETRPYLSGVLLEAVGGRARMVATDGHRLARGESDWTAKNKITPPVLIPRRGVVELKRLLEGREAKVDVGIHQGVLFLQAGDSTVTIKLAEAAFPPYENVIPHENDRIVEIDRSALLDGLRRISLVASERTGAMRLELGKDEVRISTENPDVGEARETIATNYGGEAMCLGFNGRYLIEALEAFSAEMIRAEFGGELDGVVFREGKSEDTLAVVMPMRI